MRGSVPEFIPVINREFIPDDCRGQKPYSTRAMDPVAFKANLAALIRERGMTEGGLSKRIGRDESALRKLIENTGQWPRLDTAIKLAQELDCTLDELVFGPSGANPLATALAALRQEDRDYVAGLIARLRASEEPERP